LEGVRDGLIGPFGDAKYLCHGSGQALAVIHGDERDEPYAIGEFRHQRRRSLQRQAAPDQRGDADLYLKTDHATLVHMNSVFNAVANPHEEWPASTRVASEREFGLTEPFHPAISRA
jgi:hypothetical protein